MYSLSLSLCVCTVPVILFSLGGCQRSSAQAFRPYYFCSSLERSRATLCAFDPIAHSICSVPIELHGVKDHPTQC